MPVTASPNGKHIAEAVGSWQIRSLLWGSGRSSHVAHGNVAAPTGNDTAIAVDSDSTDGDAEPYSSARVVEHNRGGGAHGSVLSASLRVEMHDRASLLSDDVVYRRTASGQRELVMNAGSCSGLELRFLAAVTGHTPLRVLLDMGFDGPGIAAAVETLVAKRLIEPTARIEGLAGTLLR